MLEELTKIDAESPSIRSKIKKQKTALIQEEILLSAARLIAERGFRAVTVDDISGEIGYTKSIVYYYMKNKNEILWRIFEKIDRTYADSVDEVLARGGSVTDRLAGVLSMHCKNVLSHVDWSTIYNRDDNELTVEQREVVRANRRRYNKRIQELYSEGVAAGVFRDTAAVIAVSCLIGACNWPYTWFKPSGRFTTEDIAKGYAQLLINGVLKDDSRRR